MSLVAVVERADDRGGSLPQTKVVPVGMPQDTRFESYFGRGPRFRLLDVAESRWSPLYSRRRALGETGRSSSSLTLMLHVAIRTIEDHALTRAGDDVNSHIGALLREFVSVQSRIKNDAQKAALTALIDFLSGDLIDFLETGQLCLTRWRAIRQQLEAAWPELTNVERSGATNKPGAGPSMINVTSEGIRSGIPLQQALEIFQKSVNQPGTMFSTDHWLAPKLDRLRVLLSDPITDDQATALLDVLHDRHWMRDLLEWLEGSPMSWQGFFILRECREPTFDPAEDVYRFDLTGEPHIHNHGVHEDEVTDVLQSPAKTAPVAMGRG
jgi:hypothetical protein